MNLFILYEFADLQLFASVQEVVNPLGPIADLAVIIDSTYCRRHK